MSHRRIEPSCLEATVNEVRILYQDMNLLVIEKPHDVRMDGDFPVTVLKIAHALIEALDKPRWIHRLDYATSGVIVIGLTKLGAGNSGKLFQKRKTKKIYVALLKGHLRQPVPGNEENFKYASDVNGVQISETFEDGMNFNHGEETFGESIPVFLVSGPIGEETGHAFRMMINGENPREAKTQVLPIGYGYLEGVEVTKVLLKPMEGRRHQLRLHCLHMGHPIMGDVTYGTIYNIHTGSTDDGFYGIQERMYLHAKYLKLPFSTAKIPLKQIRDFPADLEFNAGDSFHIDTAL